MSTDCYNSLLSERYASKEMQYIFSPDKKFRTWRRLWIALAETEKELGLDITDEQIEELKAHKDDICTFCVQNIPSWYANFVAYGGESIAQIKEKVYVVMTCV